MSRSPSPPTCPLRARASAPRAWAAAWAIAALVGLAASPLAPLSAAPSTKSAAAPAASPASISYERDVLLLLRARCQGCHQPARREGGLDLTGPHGWLDAGDSGEPAVVPGDPDASALIVAVTPDPDGAASMPQQGPPLSEAEIGLLRQWIAAGAPAPMEPNRPQFDAAHPPTYDAPAAITALDVSPDGRLIALSGTSEVLLLDASSAARGERSIVHRLIGRASRIESVRFSPGGDLLAVAGGIPGEFGELQVWDASGGELVLSQTVGADTLRGVAWSPDGARVACGASEAKLRVFDVATGQMALEQGAHADWVTAVAFSSDGKFLISAARDKTLKLIDGAAGRLVDNITAVSPGVPGGPLFTLARHPHRDMVVAGGAEGVPRTYLVHRLVERKIGDDSNLVRAYPKTIGRIFAAAFSPDGKRLATAASDGAHGRVEIFAVPEAIEPPQEIRLIQGKVSTERSAAEAAQLDAYHGAGAVRLASSAGAMGPAYAVAFLADGRRIVSGGADGLLRVHDAVHGSRVAAFSPFPDATPRATEPQQAGSPAGAVEFLTDVMPVLAKVGCNSGTCHGAREGQNGFSLSLRGYDAQADFLALTDDLAGRRVDRGRPEASLMLQKASGAAPHGGGVVLEPGSPRYETVRRWIAAGARYNPAAQRVASITVTPANPVVERAGATVGVRVHATYPDGSVRDVTGDAFIESGDTEVATADAAGVLTALRRGEAPILVRYEGAYAATTLTVMGDRRGFQPTAPPVYNRIDELVDAKLARLKIAASGLATDEQFLRRVHLDLTGLPPTADAVRAFLADRRDSREKRAQVVEDLLGGTDYIEHWTNRWADLLLVNGKFVGREGAAAYRQWIRTAVAENWPYDRLVRELITATGSTREHPAGSYFKALRSPELIAETTSHVFLGVRFNCNKCHDHPFERWTQDDYYSWAANFADVRLDKDPASGDRTLGGSAVEDDRPLYEFVADRPGGAVTHLRTGAAAAPRFPYPARRATAASGVPSGAETLRGKTALWLTSADNRYFASSFVNRVWAALTGVGLIEPVDDIRAGNPPTNPELLAWLTEQFVAHDFDVQWLIRTICASRTYQLSPETNRWNEDDRRNYSHALPRRLSAETLFDAVHLAVGSRSRLPGMPRGARAAELPDPGQELEGGLLSKLGRPARETGCECERSSELQLGPLMALVNGPTFAAAIDDPRSDLARLERSTPDDGALVEEIFLRILNRAPTAAERAAALQALEAPADDRPAVAEALAQTTAALAPGYDAWRVANRPVAWTVLSDLEATGPEGTQFRRLEDGSLLASGATAKGAYRVTAQAPAMTLRGLRLEALPDESLPRRGPGRAPNGNFVLSHIRLEVQKPDGSTRRAKFRSAAADYSQNDFNVAGAIDGNSRTGWGVDEKIGERHVAAFELVRPVALEGGARVIVELDHQHDDKHVLGRFRLSLTADAPPLLPPDHPAKWRDRLAVAPGDLPPAEEAELREYYLTLDRRYRDLERAQRLVANPRLAAVQDLAWALINGPAFLFNY